MKAEYLLPIHIGGMLEENKCTVKVLETKDKWFGVTYKDTRYFAFTLTEKVIWGKFICRK